MLETILSNSFSWMKIAICSKGPNEQYASIASNNSIVPNRRWDIILINYGNVYWSTYASLELDELMIPNIEHILWHSGMLMSVWLLKNVHTLRPRQNGRRFADDTFKRIFLNKNVTISIKISLKFVPKVSINNIPALVQIMAWRRLGDKPLSEPMMVGLLTHICVTRPQCGAWILEWHVDAWSYYHTRYGWQCFLHWWQHGLYGFWNSHQWLLFQSQWVWFRNDRVILADDSFH